MIYAVKVGAVPGLYSTWDECKKQVHGYPGAVFKKFQDFDMDGVRDFMQEVPVNAICTEKDEAPIVPDEGVWIAYTDGSYNPETKACGAGLVLFHDNIKETFSKLNDDPAAEGMRNVTGEILAAWTAIDMATSGGACKLIIRHDYTGISQWANGKWRANNQYTKAYQAKVAAARYLIDIEFEHVPAHTGVTYNEEADRLAKKACGLEGENNE